MLLINQNGLKTGASKRRERFRGSQQARDGPVRSGSNSFDSWLFKRLPIAELVPVATSDPPDGAVEGCLSRTQY